MASASIQLANKNATTVGSGVLKRCPLAYVSLYILANLGSRISKSLQRIFLKLHGLTKFGTINRFMKMNFCLNEKHKKLQFCVTSSKGSIVNCASHSNLYFYWPAAKEAIRKMSKSCDKVIKNFVATVRRAERFLNFSSIC